VGHRLNDDGTVTVTLRLVIPLDDGTVLEHVYDMGLGDAEQMFALLMNVIVDARNEITERAQA
jgi:hypothetical protein